MEKLERRVALLENGRLEEYSVERNSSRNIVGSVYKGKVKNIEIGLKAMFVDIGFEKNAFLHFWDAIPAALDSGIEEPLRRLPPLRKSSRHADFRPDPACLPALRGTQLRRLMSRFATVRSEEDRLDSLADPSSLGDLDEDDPKSVAQWMKKMGNEMGEDLGDDVDEALEQEAGGDLEAPSEATGGGDDL